MPNEIILDKLLQVMTLEQAGLLVDSLVRAHGRAVDRKSVQSVEVVFSEKGFLRQVKCSDDLFIPAPRMFNPE